MGSLWTGMMEVVRWREKERLLSGHLGKIYICLQQLLQNKNVDHSMHYFVIENSNATILRNTDIRKTVKCYYGYIDNHASKKQCERPAFVF